jgi:FkbM family methyltransferase
MSSGASDTKLSPTPTAAGVSNIPSAAMRLALGLAGLLRQKHAVVPLGQMALPGRSAGTKAAIRALATGVPMQDAMLCRVLGRYKMLVDPADRGFAPHLVLDGYWEWWTTNVLARNLRRGQRVAEAGACYGYFTLLMADLVGPQGRVTAFEPNPDAAALLQRNLELNGLAERTRVVRAAIGAAEGSLSAPLLVPPHAPMAARIGGSELAGVDGPGADQRVLRVPCRPLDSLADEPIDWVKLDLPGSAAPAWHGMQRLLERRPQLRILMGFDPARTPQPASFLEQVAQRLPLRVVDHAGEVRATTAAALTAGGVSLLYLAKD